MLSLGAKIESLTIFCDHAFMETPHFNEPTMDQHFKQTSKAL